MSDDLDDLLGGLEDADLVRRLAEADLAYIFKHALTQETAYHSLLRRKRREIHLRVARSYERLYADRLDEQAALLAQHFAEAGDDAKTVEYSLRAGNSAARVYANAEALTHYTRALDIVRAVLRPQPEEHAGAGRRLDEAHARSLLAPLYLGAGRALEMTVRFLDAVHLYEEMEALAQQLGDRRLELVSLLARAGVLATPNPAHDAIASEVLLERTQTLARELHDAEAEAKALWIHMLMHAFNGNPREAVGYGEQALALARQMNLREQVAFILNGLFMAYWPIGEISRAEAALMEAREIWQSLDNPPMLAENLSRFSLLHLASGDYDSAIAESEEAFRVAESASHVWGQANSRAMIGHVYMERGEVGKAIAVMEEALSLGVQSRHPAVLIGTQADLAWTYGYLGDMDRAVELARAACEAANNIYPLLSPWAMAVLGRLYGMQGKLEQADELITSSYRSLKPQGSFHANIWVGLAASDVALRRGDARAAVIAASDLLDYLESTGWRTFRPDALYYRSRGLQALDHVDEARSLLIQAWREAEALGSRRSLWPVLFALSEIERSGAREAEARASAGEARAILSYIAAQVPSPELRRTFLSLPHVSVVFQRG